MMLSSQKSGIFGKFLEIFYQNFPQDQRFSNSGQKFSNEFKVLPNFVWLVLAKHSLLIKTQL